MRQYFHIVSALFVIIITTTLGHAQEVNSIDIDRIQRATVFIIQVGGENFSMRCVGSGTIVRFDGLILTNAHHVVQSTTCSGEEIIIAITLDPEEPPVPKYRAEIVQINEGLDLALLRIARELDGRIIEPGTLPVLPFVEVGNASVVQLDETITVVGYPGIGNEGVQSIPGTITGFVAEPSGGEKSWFKTTTISQLPGTMSGGGAYNQQGQLIGVPTTAPTTLAGDASNCSLVEDTNEDGFINNNDSCVPLGDFIDVLRPAQFAEPLIRSASLGLSIEPLTIPRFQTTSSEQATVDSTRMFFSLSVTNNLPSRVVGTAPTGTTSLFLFFDYQNFTPQTTYELRVNIDGVPNNTFSLPPVRWSGGRNGLWYIGSSGQPWPNGVYEFRLFINGIAAATKTITVGGVAQELPAFSNVAFGFNDPEDNNRLQGDSYILPGAQIASAQFIYRNMQPGLSWTVVWYFNGVALTQQPDVWGADDGTNGVRNVSIQPEGGLRPGNYRVELYLQQSPTSDRQTLSAMGDFIVAGSVLEGLPRPDVFTTPQFIRANSPLEAPTGNPGTSFPDGANTLYARFDWRQIAVGTLWTMQWTVDDTIFFAETVPWNGPESGDDFTIRVTAPGGLPDGNYGLNLLINGILLESAEVTIGIGQLEINRLEETGGTQLQGQIVDADTGDGIEGATFVLISEDFSIADFVWDQEQIFALAVTDSNGQFEIDRSLILEAPYSVFILVEGYLPIKADGFTITPDFLAEEGGSPIEMFIALTQD